MCHDIVLIKLNQYKHESALNLEKGMGKGTTKEREKPLAGRLYIIAQFWIMLHCCTGNADWYLKFDVNSDQNLRYNHTKHIPLGSLHI